MSGRVDMGPSLCWLALRVSIAALPPGGDLFGQVSVVGGTVGTWGVLENRLPETGGLGQTNVPPDTRLKGDG